MKASLETRMQNISESLGEREKEVKNLDEKREQLESILDRKEKSLKVWFRLLFNFVPSLLSVSTLELHSDLSQYNFYVLKYSFEEL